MNPEVQPPAAVRRGSILLVVMAGLGLVLIVIALLAWRHFAPARAVLLHLGGEGEVNETDSVRGALIFRIGLGAAAILGVAFAVLVQRPRRWAQVGSWILTAFVVINVLFGISLGPDTAGSAPSAQSTPEQVADYNLLPQWYPMVNAVLVTALGIVAIAAGLYLSRATVLDFYRKASRQPDDPRWAAFVQRQQDIIAGD